MNNSELNRILKAARVPERAQEFWAHFPQRVTSRLHWRTNPAEKQPARPLQLLAWVAMTITVCLVIGFLIGQWRGHTDAVAENGLLQNEKVIKEMLDMFPNRVRAVVQDEHGLNLLLSDKEDVPASTPLWVKICNGRYCSVVVTFSGQKIQIGRQEVTVLADTHGKIILEGDNLLWSDGESILANNKLKIEAKTLRSI